MANSTNPKIQQLMNDIDSLDDHDDNLEAKLQLIAQRMAEEQQKLKSKVGDFMHGSQNGVPVDPADAFACEGCQ